MLRRSHLPLIIPVHVTFVSTDLVASLWSSALCVLAVWNFHPSNPIPILVAQGGATPFSDGIIISSQVFFFYKKVFVMVHCECLETCQPWFHFWASDTCTCSGRFSAFWSPSPPEKVKVFKTYSQPAWWRVLYCTARLERPHISPLTRPLGKYQDPGYIGNASAGRLSNFC